MPTNIAEGTKRQGRQDYARFINMAEGSLAETEYLVLLSRDLGYLAPKASETALAETGEIARMLNALRVKIEQAIPTNRQPTHPAQRTMGSEAVAKATLQSLDHTD